MECIIYGNDPSLYMHPRSSCQYLLSGSEDCTVKVWEVETGSLLHTLTPDTEGERGSVRSVTAGPKGRVVASCGSK